jgi:hypothetical protein
MVKTSFGYLNVTIFISGTARSPCTTVDEQINSFRRLALHNVNLIQFLKETKTECVDNLLKLIPIQHLNLRNSENINTDAEDKNASVMSLQDHQRQYMLAESNGRQSILSIKDKQNQNIEVIHKKEFDSP